MPSLWALSWYFVKIPKKNAHLPQGQALPGLSFKKGWGTWARREGGSPSWGLNSVLRMPPAHPEQPSDAA